MYVSFTDGEASGAVTASVSCSRTRPLEELGIKPGTVQLVDDCTTSWAMLPQTVNENVLVGIHPNCLKKGITSALEATLSHNVLFSCFKIKHKPKSIHHTLPTGALSNFLRRLIEINSRLHNHSPHLCFTALVTAEGRDVTDVSFNVRNCMTEFIDFSQLKTLSLFVPNT